MDGKLDVALSLMEGVSSFIVFPLLLQLQQFSEIVPN
jgi:hypothetical protein